jgi:hypothetical protein
LAILEVCDASSEKYAMVIAEGKDLFASDFTLADYAEALS